MCGESPYKGAECMIGGHSGRKNIGRKIAMKKARKGFTLVELLIVVAILAILSATMMVSMSGVTAKAKASSIAANLDACRAAAILYYAKHGDEQGFADTTTTTMLEAELSMWSEMKGKANTEGSTDGDTIYYIAGTTSATSAPDKWAVKVDFSNDPEADAIAKALKNIKGYSSITTTAFAGDGVFDFLGATPAYAADATVTSTTSLCMTLITGKITVLTASDTSTFTEDSASATEETTNTNTTTSTNTIPTGAPDQPAA